MRFAASSIVREAISHAILDIQLWHNPTDIPHIASIKTLERYKPIFQDKADALACDVHDWFAAQGKMSGDLELLRRRLFLTLWKDERFGKGEKG